MKNILIHLIPFYLGRILNRFSRDMGCIDETLPDNLFDMLMVGSYMIKSTLN